MQTRQEVEVGLILPAVRRHLSMDLKELGMKQAEIARRLKLTKAAVTQYVKGIRGKNLTLDSKTKEEIKIAAQKITDNSNSSEELQKILNSMKERKVICKYHRVYNNELGEKCCLCFKEE
jgi:predicted transcriptional regulator